MAHDLLLGAAPAAPYRARPLPGPAPCCRGTPSSRRRRSFRSLPRRRRSSRSLPPSPRLRSRQSLTISPVGLPVGLPVGRASASVGGGPHVAFASGALTPPPGSAPPIDPIPPPAAERRARDVVDGGQASPSSASSARAQTIDPRCPHDRPALASGGQSGSRSPRRHRSRSRQRRPSPPPPLPAALRVVLRMRRAPAPHAADPPRVDVAHTLPRVRRRVIGARRSGAWVLGLLLVGPRRVSLASPADPGAVALAAAPCHLGDLLLIETAPHAFGLGAARPPSRVRGRLRRSLLPPPSPRRACSAQPTVPGFADPSAKSKQRAAWQP